MLGVLVVEDEDVIRKGIIFSIPWEELGLKVVGEAINGDEGIKLIEKYKPDIVITDINMPIVDGLEMIKKTKDNFVYSTIIISGYSDFEFARKAIKYGVSEYILKPYTEEELCNAIKVTIKQCLDRERLRLSHGLVDIPQILEKVDAEGKGEMVKTILSYISIHYKDKITIDDIVNLVNYGERMINIKFKDEVGTTVIDYINRYRIQKAINKLHMGNVYINDIAIECGFGDYKYFGVVFKKYIGVSPKKYLNKINTTK